MYQVCRQGVCNQFHFVNTVGSYHCMCNDGFHQDPKGGNGCVDIDECAESPGLCQQNCINIWGSYRCSCNPGFPLQHDNRSCQDIDECEQFKDHNLCVGICVNQAGSYSCQCPEGYRIGTDGRTCQDIDECLGGSNCHNSNEVCLNTRGGYRCNSITCPPNFIKDPEHKKYYLRENSIMCKRECKPYDSVCLLNNTNTITYQFISIPTIRILHGPMVITRIRAVTLGSRWAFKVHFEVIFGNEELYFDFQQGTKLGALRLTRPVFGPKHFLVKIQMKVFTARNFLSAKHWAYVDIDVSNYDF